MEVTHDDSRAASTIPFLILTLTLVSGMLVARAGRRRRARTAAPAQADARGARRVSRGDQGCNDCHTPWKMGPKVPSRT